MKTHIRKSFLICLLGFLLVPLSVSAVVVSISGLATQSTPAITPLFNGTPPTGYTSLPTDSTALFDSAGTYIPPSVTTSIAGATPFTLSIGIASSAPIIIDYGASGFTLTPIVGVGALDSGLLPSTIATLPTSLTYAELAGAPLSNGSDLTGINVDLYEYSINSSGVGPYPTDVTYRLDAHIAYEEVGGTSGLTLDTNSTSDGVGLYTIVTGGSGSPEDPNNSGGGNDPVVKVDPGSGGSGGGDPPPGIPEPSSTILFTLGLSSLIIRRKRK